MLIHDNAYNDESDFGAIQKEHPFLLPLRKGMHNDRKVRESGLLEQDWTMAA